jgi:hypothetical protein
MGVADEDMNSAAVVIAAAHVDSRMARVYTPSLAEYGSRSKDDWMEDAPIELQS